MIGQYRVCWRCPCSGALQGPGKAIISHITWSDHCDQAEECRLGFELYLFRRSSGEGDIISVHPLDSSFERHETQKMEQAYDMMLMQLAWAVT